MDNISLNIN